MNAVAEKKIVRCVVKSIDLVDIHRKIVAVQMYNPSRPFQAVWPFWAGKGFAHVLPILHAFEGQT